MEFLQFSTDILDENFDVLKRLQVIESWEQEYKLMDASLHQHVIELFHTRNLAKEQEVKNQLQRKMALIGIQRRRIKSFKVRVPLEIPISILTSHDASKAICEKLAPQY